MNILPTPAPRVAAVTAYSPPRHPAPVDLWLDGNEGQRPPDELFAALVMAGPEALRRYPSTSALAAILAGRLGVAAERVLVTAGGDDAIDRVCRATLGDGRTIVLPAPTFEMIARYARLAGGEVVEVAWPGAVYPTEEVIARVDELTALVAIVSPNNPTGAVATADDVRRVCAAARHAVVLVDLAYAEFTDDELSAAALAEPNAVVVRTLSKAWGLAGARVGYAVGSPEIVGWLRAVGAPYAVAAPSLALAEAWLARGELAMAGFVARVREERVALEALLAGLGARVSPSAANFVFVRVRDAAWVRDALAGLGVAVRAFPGRADLADALRISLPGEAAAFARLTRALRAALAPEALLLAIDGVPLRRDVLTRLAGRLPLAAISRRSRAEVMELLARCEVEDLFRCVITDADAMGTALTRIGARTGWLIAAEPEDMQAARVAGVVPLGVSSASESPAALYAAGAARVLADIDEVEGLLG